MEKKSHAELSHNTLFFCGVVLCALLLLRFWRTAAPFVLAWVVCLPIRQLSLRLSKATKLPLGVCAVICLVLILTGLIFLLKLGVSLLVSELLALYNRLTENPQLISDFFDGVRSRLDSVGGFFSVFDRLSENKELLGITQSLESFLSDFVGRAVTSVVQKITGAAVNAASKIPELLLFFVVFLTSCFYFSCDDGKISGFFLDLLPRSVQHSLPKLKKGLKDVIWGYIRAILLLCGITFFIVIVGLLCIGCRYAVLLSLLIAVIDMLPILGSGVILLPWSLICFLCSDIKRGIALLVIWAVATVARQVAEPRLLGKSIGLHPLATLASVYVGAKLFGLVGIFAGPLVAVGIKALLPTFIGEKTK